MAAMQEFNSGATRSADDGKADYEGFLSPLVIERYGQYMNEHRVQADGKLRESDNWQKGIPLAKYFKSLYRHFHVAWKLHRGYAVEPERVGTKMVTPTIEDALCAVLFNTMGYLHEYLKNKGSEPSPTAPAQQTNTTSTSTELMEVLKQLERDRKQDIKLDPGPFNPKPRNPYYEDNFGAYGKQPGRCRHCGQQFISGRCYTPNCIAANLAKNKYSEGTDF